MIKSRWVITAGCAALLLVLGWLDYVTGYELGFFIFYSIPVAITAWHVGRLPAILMSFASALVWLMADSYSGQKYSSVFYVYWNIAVRCGCFVINAFTVSKIRRIMDQQKQMATDLADLQAQATKLRSLLPVCSVCRNPRNDEQYRRDLATYLDANTMSHTASTCCPACGASSKPTCPPIAVGERTLPYQRSCDGKNSEIRSS